MSSSAISAELTKRLKTPLSDKYKYAIPVQYYTEWYDHSSDWSSDDRELLPNLCRSSTINEDVKIKDLALLFAIEEKDFYNLTYDNGETRVQIVIDKLLAPARRLITKSTKTTTHGNSVANDTDDAQRRIITGNDLKSVRQEHRGNIGIVARDQKPDIRTTVAGCDVFYAELKDPDHPYEGKDSESKAFLELTDNSALKDLRDPVKYRWNLPAMGEIPYVFSLAAGGGYSSKSESKCCKAQFYVSVPTRDMHNVEVRAIGEELNLLELQDIFRFELYWTNIVLMINELVRMYTIPPPIKERNEEYMYFDHQENCFIKTEPYQSHGNEKFLKLLTGLGDVDEHWDFTTNIESLHSLLKDQPTWPKNISRMDLLPCGDVSEGESCCAQCQEYAQPWKETSAKVGKAKSQLCGHVYRVKYTELGYKKYPWDLTSFVQYVCDLLKGVRSLHVLGFCHRDVRTLNVIFAREKFYNGVAQGKWKLIDLDFAAPTGNNVPIRMDPNHFPDKLQPVPELKWYQCHDFRQAYKFIEKDVLSSVFSPEQKVEIFAPFFEAFKPISYPEDEEADISQETFAAALENMSKLG